MERPKIDNYIKQDPSELTTGEILIGYQKYAKALDDYINKQLILSGVVGQSEQLICPDCKKDKRMQGNGIIHQLCECGE